MKCGLVHSFFPADVLDLLPEVQNYSPAWSLMQVVGNQEYLHGLKTT